MKRICTLALLAATALFALPAVAEAKAKAKAKCTINLGFVVKGTVSDFTANDTSTSPNEASVTVAVKGGNSHARRSGELTDRSFGVSASSDAFRLKLSGYESGEAVEDGDKVQIIGKIAYTKKRCAPGQSLAARYGAVNVSKVKIVDGD